MCPQVRYCHDGSVNDLVYLEHASAFLSGGSDGALVLHPEAEEDSRQIADLPGPISALYSVADTDQIVVGREDGTLEIHSLRERGQRELGFHTGLISDIGGSDGFSGVVTTSYDGTIAVWAPTEWRIQNKLVDDALAAVAAVAVAPSGDWFTTSDVEDRLHVWRPEGDSTEQSVLERAATVVDMGVTPGSDRLVTLDYEGTVAVWNTDVWAPKHSYEAGDGGERPLALHPGGELIALGKRQSVTVITVAGEIASHYEGDMTRVTSIAFSADGDRLTAGCEDGCIISMDFELQYQQDPYHLPG